MDDFVLNITFPFTQVDPDASPELGIALRGVNNSAQRLTLYDLRLVTDFDVVAGYDVQVTVEPRTQFYVELSLPIMHVTGLRSLVLEALLVAATGEELPLRAACPQLTIKPTAILPIFFSRSLNPEDSDFIDRVDDLLRLQWNLDLRTVGKPDRVPEEEAVHAAQRIAQETRGMILVATPRFADRAGVPHTFEWAQAEAAMMVAYHKPVLIIRHPNVRLTGFLGSLAVSDGCNVVDLPPTYDPTWQLAPYIPRLRQLARQGASVLTWIKEHPGVSFTVGLGVAAVTGATCYYLGRQSRL